MILISGPNGKAEIVDRIARKNDTIILSFDPLWPTANEVAHVAWSLPPRPTMEDFSYVITSVLKEAESSGISSPVVIIYTNLRRYQIDPYIRVIWLSELELKEQSKNATFVLTYFNSDAR